MEVRFYTSTYSSAQVVDIFSARTGHPWLIPSPLSLADIDSDLDLVNHDI